ncbi:MAG: FG-GAP repeat domain-containing protein, partial [Isosphaeraceae bacterium]
RPTGTFDAGNGPAGLSTADVNGDDKLDLLIGNEFGDLLILLGNGDLGNGDVTFQPYQRADRNIALAVADFDNGTKGLIYANQSLDRVVVDYGGPKTVVGDRSTGLLAPGAVQLADLNGDGIPDLIVANSGSNNVLVYLGQRDGQFGQALNGGHGFFAGTNPVGISVADVDGDGRPDLVVANKGSNDVSILLNRKQGNSVTFIPGPRLKVGSGPVSTVVKDVTGDGIPDVLVSNSQSNNVMLLPGVGGGFFNDVNPPTFSVGSQPGPLFVGPFTRPGQLDLVTVNAGSNDLTLIPDFFHGGQPLPPISSGGLDPVAAFEFSSGSGFDNLVVANNGDDTFALLEGGPDGLNLTSTETEPGLNPTDLAFLAFTDGQVQFYAATEGSEAATRLTFLLGGEAGGMPGGETGDMPTVPGLQPLRGAALPLIATLLTLTIETSTAEFDLSATNGEAAAAVSFLPVSTVTVGQSLSEHASTGEGENGDEEEPNEPKEPDLPVTQESSSWQPFLMGLDEALDQFCRDHLDQFMSRDEPAPDKAQPPHALSKPLNLWQRDQASPEARGTIGTDSNHLPEANQGQIIDEAIRSLWADESRPVRTFLTPTSVPLTSDGTTPAETAPADATLLSTEPVQRQDGPLLSSYERGFEALTEFAVSLLLAAFVARRIEPPSTRQCTPTNPFSSLRLLRRRLFRFR